eukprot:GHVT01095066.1.p1 GENE.GHVT01095066.1~~GHVT01095066.1.p1  ORF type:complete len:270 (+),score=37.56 GHVT01095066.1:624-1433(+)
MPRLEYISPDGYRLDARRTLELRTLQCRIGGLAPNADGSAYVEQGNTKVIAYVYGPREGASHSQRVSPQSAGVLAAAASSPSTASTPPLAAGGPPVARTAERTAVGTVACEVSMASSAVQGEPRRRGGDRTTTELATAIRNTFNSVIQLSLFPRSVISIFIHVIEDDGGALACCLNAACLALIDGGIALLDWPAATTCSWLCGEPVVDPTVIELSASSAKLTIAIMTRSTNISLLALNSRMPIDRVNVMVKAGRAACGAIGDAMKVRSK